MLTCDFNREIIQILYGVQYLCLESLGYSPRKKRSRKKVIVCIAIGKNFLE